MQTSVGFHSDLYLFTSAARNDLHSFFLLTVSLWRPVNSNTEGVVEIPYFSPLSDRPRDIMLN